MTTKTKLTNAWHIHTIDTVFGADWDHDFIAYGNTLDEAINSLDLEPCVRSISGQRIPRLDNLEINKVNSNSMLFSIGNKQYKFDKEKDRCEVKISRVSILDNGKKFYQHTFDLDIPSLSYSVNAKVLWRFYRYLTK